MDTKAIETLLPRKPGKQLEIRPAIVDNLKWVRVSYHSVLGKIVSNWRRDGRRVIIHIVIPAQVTARVFVPTVNSAVVRVKDQSPSSKGIMAIHTRAGPPGAIVYEIPSGNYLITSPIAK